MANVGVHERAFDVESLAEALCCSKSTVYNLIKSGEIRAFKIGKRGLRIAAEEVRRWQRASEDRNATESGIAPSAGEKGSRLPTSTIRALVGASKG